MEFNEGERKFAPRRKGISFMKYMAAVLLLVVAMLAQNTPSMNKGVRLDIPGVSREAHGAVVSIVMSDKEGHPIAQGSGFLISKDGHVVTNYHVIENGSSAVIKFPDGAFFAVDGVLASDKNRDVAIIKAHGNSFKALTLGNSDRLQVGEEVVAIGNPLSLESTVSNGIVSAIRTVEDEGGKFLQITAPISPGSSGGPLFNMAGEVVGITTSHLVGGQNLNFAIPINDVKSVLARRFSRTSAPAPFPDEPEAAAVMPEATARTDNANPSLEETEQWMKDNVGVVTWNSQAVRLYVDGEEVANPHHIIIGYCRYTDSFCGPLYQVSGGFAVNVMDGKSHDWRRVTKVYDLTFKGCSMTVDDSDAISDSTGTTMNVDADDKFKFIGTQTFDLHHYDPHVTVQEDLITDDLFESDSTFKTHKLVVRKGTEYVNPTATVTAIRTSHYPHDWPIHLDLSYPFAERFAKALEHAINLCGGKSESF
jgi:S1-C subfamily serine protease